MKKVIYRIIRFISFRIVGRNLTKQFLYKIFNALDLDMLQVAHNFSGINSYGALSETGEEYFLKKILTDKFKNKPVILFDIGANVGNYSLYLNELFPSALIYSFEPNPISFQKMKAGIKGIHNIHIQNIGIGKGVSQLALHTYRNDPASEHASMIKEVMTEQHDSPDCIEFLVDVIDLDSFCIKNNISKIDFLKIDTEGFELSVLQGATKLINAKAIGVIQFEFNEMNVYSRVFLYDFYQLLPDYTFYRLKSDQLIPLGKYDSKNEIFKFQNIIAISKESSFSS